MPRYFFNLVMGKVVHYGREGHDLGDANAARLLAVQKAHEFMLRKALLTQLNPAECSVEVVNETGDVLVSVPFSEVSEPVRPT